MGRPKKVLSNNEPPKVEREPIVTSINLGNDYSAPPETKIEETVLPEDGEKPLLSIRPEGGENGERVKRPYKKRESKTESAPEPLITGDMILMFMDLIVPMVTSVVSSKVAGVKVSPDDLMLTDKQKANMKIFADKCAERIDINVNPFLALLVVGAGTYSMNYIKADKK